MTQDPPPHSDLLSPFFAPPKDCTAYSRRERLAVAGHTVLVPRNPAP